MTDIHMKLKNAPTCFIAYEAANCNTLITFKADEYEEELRLYNPMGIILLKTFRISYKNTQTENKCDIKSVKRCQMSKNSNFVIIGEEDGFGCELCWDSNKEELFPIPEPGFTFVMNQSEKFVTFTDSNGLSVNFLLPCQKPGETMRTLEKVTHLKVGKCLLRKPLVMSASHIVFIQVNKDDNREICLLDCGADPETTSCQIKLEDLKIPEENTIIDIFLTADESGVWIYHIKPNNSTDSSAVLWKPDLNSPKIPNQNKGHMVGVIECLSDFHQLEPKQVEEDFNRLNFKSISQDYSIHLHQWRKELEDKFGFTLVVSWLNRIRNSHKINGVTVINYDANHQAIVVSSDLNAIYLVNWSDSSIQYYIKFSTSTISHAIFRRVDRTLRVTLEDGKMLHYIVSSRNLLLFYGEEPQCEHRPVDDQPIPIRAATMLAPASQRKSHGCC